MALAERGPSNSGYESGVSPVTQALTVNVKDDELMAVVVSHTVLNLEEGQQGSYRLALTQAPADGESVTITVQRPAGVDVSPTTPVVLGANNWQPGVLVQVTPQADNVSEPAGTTATVQHQVESSGGGDDAKFGAATASNVVINVSDAPSS